MIKDDFGFRDKKDLLDVKEFNAALFRNAILEPGFSFAPMYSDEIPELLDHYNDTPKSSTDNNKAENHVALQLGDLHFSSLKASKYDGKYNAVAKQVLERDNHCCQFCGFQARNYQDVISVSENYCDNNIEDLQTICVFCKQTQFLTHISEDNMEGGIIIYLPEITQTQLNMLSHVIFTTINSRFSGHEKTQDIYEKLKKRRLKDVCGYALDKPEAFGKILHAAHIGDDRFQALTKNLRLMPTKRKFSHIFTQWQREALDNMCGLSDAQLLEDVA